MKCRVHVENPWSNNCKAPFRIKPSICDHFGQDIIALIWLLETPNVCVKVKASALQHALQRGNVLVVRKGHGSETILQLEQFRVIGIFFQRTLKLYD